MPQRANYFSREMEDDDIYIWAGFAKPGKHTVMIQDPINIGMEPIIETFLVDARNSDIMKMTAP